MLLNGKTIVAVEGLGEAFKFGARKIEQRAIEQPQTEQVVQRPRRLYRTASYQFVAAALSSADTKLSDSDMRGGRVYEDICGDLLYGRNR